MFDLEDCPVASPSLDGTTGDMECLCNGVRRDTKIVLKCVCHVSTGDVVHRHVSSDFAPRRTNAEIFGPGREVSTLLRVLPG